MRGALGLQIKAALVGDFEKEVEAGRLQTVKAGQGALFEYAGEIQSKWRQDITSSRLNNSHRLVKTIRVKTYPNRGLNAAARVFSKFPVIQRAFEQSSVIKGKTGLWLAIPLPAAGSRAPRRGENSFGRRGKTERITPGGFERRSGLKLRFVYRRNEPSLLVVDGAQLDRRRGGKAIAYRGKGAGSKLYGPNGRTIVVFLLVKQVRTPKLLSGKVIRARARANADGRMAQLFVKHFETAASAPLMITGPST